MRPIPCAPHSVCPAHEDSDARPFAEIELNPTDDSSVDPPRAAEFYVLAEKQPVKSPAKPPAAFSRRRYRRKIRRELSCEATTSAEGAVDLLRQEIVR